MFSKPISLCQYFLLKKSRKKGSAQKKSEKVFRSKKSEIGSALKKLEKLFRSQKVGKCVSLKKVLRSKKIRKSVSLKYDAMATNLRKFLKNAFEITYCVKKTAAFASEDSKRVGIGISSVLDKITCRF